MRGGLQWTDERAQFTGNELHYLSNCYLYKHHCSMRQTGQNVRQPTSLISNPEPLIGEMVLGPSSNSIQSGTPTRDELFKGINSWQQGFDAIRMNDWQIRLKSLLRGPETDAWHLTQVFYSHVKSSTSPKVPRRFASPRVSARIYFNPAPTPIGGHTASSPQKNPKGKISSFLWYLLHPATILRDDLNAHPRRSVPPKSPSTRTQEPIRRKIPPTSRSNGVRAP